MTDCVDIELKVLVVCDTDEKEWVVSEILQFIWEISRSFKLKGLYFLVWEKSLYTIKRAQKYFW